MNSKLKNVLISLFKFEERLEKLPCDELLLCPGKKISKIAINRGVKIKRILNITPIRAGIVSHLR
jgi:hypothetical protein